MNTPVYDDLSTFLAPKEINSLRLGSFQKLVSGPFHLLQLFSGIGKEIYAYAAELWLVVDRPLQKRHVTVLENEEHIRVAAGDGLPPGQGAEEPDLSYLQVPLG
jgi:hypothetical protein